MGAEWTNQSQARALTCAVGEPRIPAKGSDGLTTLGRRNGPWWDDWRGWSEETETSQSSRSGSKAIWGVRRIFGDLKICALELLVKRPFDKKTVWILGASLLRCWGLAWTCIMHQYAACASSSFMYNDHSITMDIYSPTFGLAGMGGLHWGLAKDSSLGGIPRSFNVDTNQRMPWLLKVQPTHQQSYCMSPMHRSPHATALMTAKLTRCFCFWKPFSLFQKVLPSHGMH